MPTTTDTIPSEHLWQMLTWRQRRRYADHFCGHGHRTDGSTGPCEQCEAELEKEGFDA